MDQAEPINLQAFEALGSELFAERAEFERLEELAKIQGRKVEELKQRVMKHLDAAGKDKYHVAGHGLIYTQNRFSVPVPKGDDFRSYAAWYIGQYGEDAWYGHCSVHSATLTSFIKKELEAAAEQGAIAPQFPGLAKPEITKTLAMKKGK